MDLHVVRIVWTLTCKWSLEHLNKSEHDIKTITRIIFFPVVVTCTPNRISYIMQPGDWRRVWLLRVTPGHSLSSPVWLAVRASGECLHWQVTRSQSYDTQHWTECAAASHAVIYLISPSCTFTAEMKTHVPLLPFSQLHQQEGTWPTWQQEDLLEFHRDVWYLSPSITHLWVCARLEPACWQSLKRPGEWQSYGHIKLWKIIKNLWFPCQTSDYRISWDTF